MDLPFDGALALRRRSAWEAADAGLLLWRKDLLYFIPFFALPVWICAFSLRLLPDHLWPLSWLSLWYLRPFFDRLVLQVVSARFFGASGPEGPPVPGAGNPVRSRRLSRGLSQGLSWRLWPNLFRGLAGDLLWRRFSPWRPAMTPVRTLERLGPAQTRRRKKALSRGGIGFCVFLSAWSLTLEAILLGGEILFVLISVTMIQSGFIGSAGEFFAGKEIFLYTAWCVNGIFVESLYVCMGFSLYINSRVELEGWDLELLFRGLVRGRQGGAGHSPASVGQRGIAVVILALCLFTALPPAAFAEESPVRPPLSGEGASLETLRGILSSPEFGGKRESWGIRLRDRERKDQWSFDAAPWFPLVQRIFALILRAFLALGLLALGVFCAVYLYRLRTLGKAAGGGRGETRSLAAEEPGDSEELLAQALSLHRMGKIREAWAGCFAASLAAWSQYRGLSFPAGATEYRCLSLCERFLCDRPLTDGANPAEGAGFAELIASWVALAYGGRIPPEGAFERALSWVRDLCGTPGAGRESLP
jgi:hypothetical protein